MLISLAIELAGFGVPFLIIITIIICTWPIALTVIAGTRCIQYYQL